MMHNYYELLKKYSGSIYWSEEYMTLVSLKG